MAELFFKFSSSERFSIHPSIVNCHTLISQITFFFTMKCNTYNCAQAIFYYFRVIEAFDFLGKNFTDYITASHCTI
jgi:hypothetical protein